MCYNYNGDSMRDITKLNLKYVRSDGRYVDFDKPEMFTLTVGEIAALRRYYKDNSIARDVKITYDNEKIVNKPTTQSIVRSSSEQLRRTGASTSSKGRSTTQQRTRASSEGQRRQNTTRSRSDYERYTLSREQKYNNGTYRTKKPVRVPIGKRIVAGGLVILLAMGVGKIYEEITYEEPAAVVAPLYAGVYGQPAVIVENEDKEEVINDVSSEGDREKIREEFIKNLCSIYQLNFSVVYPKMCELTDEFSNLNYLDGHLDWVSCKGAPVYAKTEEEMLVYMMRIFSQDPGRINLSRSQLQINDGYESKESYAEIISKWAQILGVDRALIYGIIQAETGWESDLFINSNNPAGLKDGGDWWSFPTKEAGIIELMLEVLKYNRCNAYSIEEISQIHCPVDDPEDTRGLNRNWISNVTQGYEEALEIYEKLDTMLQNNGLSH